MNAKIQGAAASMLRDFVKHEVCRHCKGGIHRFGRTWLHDKDNLATCLTALNLFGKYVAAEPKQ